MDINKKLVDVVKYDRKNIIVMVIVIYLDKIDIFVIMDI